MPKIIKLPPDYRLIQLLLTHGVKGTAKMEDVSTRTVLRWKKFYGISTSRTRHEHWNYKLSYQDIREIKMLRKNGMVLREIAEQYEISRSYCGHICKGVARS